MNLIPLLTRIDLAMIATLLLIAGASQGHLPGTPTPVFTDSFETETNWQIFEEIVGGNSCYGSGIGSVGRSTAVAYEGAHSLLVWANQALSPKSNHVIGYKRIADAGQYGLWRYEFQAYIAPSTANAGQTGPEFSMQNTRPTTPNSATTAIAGIQYIANPYAETAHWRVWDQGRWAPFITYTLQAGQWYTLTLEANFSRNTYQSFSIQGANTYLWLDLSGFQITEEAKGFKDSFVITLESENLWNNCGTAGNFEYKVYYDKISLTQQVAKIALPMIRK